MSEGGERDRHAPPRIASHLIAWAARRLDTDDLADTALQLFRKRCDSIGPRRARHWYRRESLVAVVHALRSPATREKSAYDRASPAQLLASVPRELRLAGRRIRRTPMRAISFASILGVGIAVGAFMVQVRATMLEPDLGLRRSVHLVSWHMPDGQVSQTVPTSPDATWLAQAHSSVDRVIPIWPVSLTIGTEIGHVRASGQRAPAGVLEAFGREAHIGRDLETAGEVVLSHRTWVSHFGSDPGVLGRPLDMSGDLQTVVGIAPPDFDGPLCCLPPSFWVAATPGSPASSALLAAVDVRDEDASGAWLTEAVGDAAGNAQASLTPAASAPYGGDQGIIGRTLLVLLALSLLAWGGTLVNGANLILADTLDRAPELRLRRALGSHSAHATLQTLAETTWLAGLAAAVAIGVATLMVFVAPWLLPMIDGVSSVEVTVGRPTIGAIGLAAALATLLCSVPATLASLALARQTTARGPERSWMSSVGLGLQVSLAAVLLVVTGFLVNSIQSLDGSFVGFRNGATAVHYVTPAAEGRSLSAMALARELQRSALPIAVAVTRRLPVYGARRDSVFLPDGASVHAAIETVTPGFFRLIGSNLVTGSEPLRPDEAVLSEGVARAVAGSPNAAIGATVSLSDDSALRVVGVIEDATWGGGEVRPILYRGWGDDPITSAVLLVGVPEGGPRTTPPPVDEVLRALQPTGLALQPFETLDGLLTRSRVVNVFVTRLALLFGVLCTLVAFGGIHAHFARWVRMRRKMLAIQRALGARHLGQAKTVTVAALRIVIPASVVGVALGWLAGRVMQSVFAVPTPPASLPLAIAGVLVLASLMALAVPLRGASRVDELSVLKAE